MIIMTTENNCTKIRNEEEIQFALGPIKESTLAEQQNSAELGKKKKPRRILHFSDGIIEEYSTDEEGEEDRTISKANKPAIDTSTLPWSRWMLHHLNSVAINTLSAADYCGEKLAWFFGVTSPKYEYVLNEIQQRQMEEREKREREEREAECELQHNEQIRVEVKPTEQIAPKTIVKEGYDNFVFNEDETVGSDLKKY